MSSVSQHKLFLGYRVEVVNIDLQKKPEWYFKKHYQGKVPAFEKDGKVGFVGLNCLANV